MYRITLIMCNYETLINEQIKRELEAANFYYALHFKFLVSTLMKRTQKDKIQSQSTNRPKLAEMLLDRAAEEREHAGVLAKFQVERGANVKVCSFLSDR